MISLGKCKVLRKRATQKSLRWSNQSAIIFSMYGIFRQRKRNICYCWCYVGVSAILKNKDKNDEKVLAYASRALTNVEKRFSQTEKKALAIIWGVEHFHMYLYGHEFTLITNYKPLEVINGKCNSRPSARIERWVLRLQTYSFKVIYKPGKHNPADYLSRHPKRTSLK